MSPSPPCSCVCSPGILSGEQILTGWPWVLLFPTSVNPVCRGLKERHSTKPPLGGHAENPVQACRGTFGGSGEENSKCFLWERVGVLEEAGNFQIPRSLDMVMAHDRSGLHPVDSSPPIDLRSSWKWPGPAGVGHISHHMLSVLSGALRKVQAESSVMVPSFLRSLKYRGRVSCGLQQSGGKKLPRLATSRMEKNKYLECRPKAKGGSSFDQVWGFHA